MSLSISSIKTLLKLNTRVQRIQGVVAVPGVSSVSVRSMWPCVRACARLNWLFVHRVSVQSFPMTSFVYATCSCLFLLYYFWYVAPKHRRFGFRRHLPGLRSCTAYSVWLDGSASFPEIPSQGLTSAPPTVAFNHVTHTLLPVFNCISALNAVSVAESECKVQTKKKVIVLYRKRYLGFLFWNVTTVYLLYIFCT